MDWAESAITAGWPALRQKAGMVYPALTALLPIFPPDRPKRSLPFLAKAWLSPCLRASAPISERPDLAWPTRSRCCLATNSRSLRALPALDRAVGENTAVSVRQYHRDCPAVLSDALAVLFSLQRSGIVLW